MEKTCSCLQVFTQYTISHGKASVLVSRSFAYLSYSTRYPRNDFISGNDPIFRKLYIQQSGPLLILTKGIPLAGPEIHFWRALRGVSLSSPASTTRVTRRIISALFLSFFCEIAKIPPTALRSCSFLPFNLGRTLESSSGKAGMVRSLVHYGVASLVPS